jgi:hypothetical protein
MLFLRLSPPHSPPNPPAAGQPPNAGGIPAGSRWSKRSDTPGTTPNPHRTPARVPAASAPTAPPRHPARRPERNGLPTLRSGHADCKILLRILFSMMRRLAAAEAFPTGTPTPTGSVRHPQGAWASRPQLSENHHPTPAFIHQRPSGKPMKIQLAEGRILVRESTSAFPQGLKFRRRQKSLAKRLGELRSRQMECAVKPPDPARFRPTAEHSCLQRFSFQHFSFTQIPLSPISGPATGSFNGLHAKSKFLAANQFHKSQLVDQALLAAGIVENPQAVAAPMNVLLERVL